MSLPAPKLEGLPPSVRVVEVGPRDGLQNEPVTLSTMQKIEIVDLLSATGLREIEVSAFVHPDRVPQLADAAAVFAGIQRAEGVRYSALVPNARGLARAAQAGVAAIAFFTAASETFTAKNIGMTIPESLQLYRELIPQAASYGMHVRVYISTAFVCPFEGIVAPEVVLAMSEELLGMGADELSVGDTIGHATPAQVARLAHELARAAPATAIAWHFHDTSGFALANVLTALELGATAFDASAGGYGGCPFAPGASGNLATEDLVGLLEAMGVSTGVDLERLAVAAHAIERAVGRAAPGRYLRRLDAAAMTAAGDCGTPLTA
ncbi:MAG: hydroxymethylglutaryl-CoA lyase [Armatimonadetes bacterium]|nr:hydroxymethylglutaryl-CoA lyase [Armatimonadota bacterium]MDE2205747.1 hydroxymethylglutaryl-CoA lyase [Armatimonadota bacterium]